MRLNAYFFLLSVLWCLSAALVQADVRRVWDEKPLTLTLPVGHEVRVNFPTEVAVQVPLGISEKLLSLQPNPRMIYWTATEGFGSARVIATATDGRTVYVIDLAADVAAATDDIVIEDPARISQLPSASTQDLSSDNRNLADEVLEDPAEIILTRFASQTLYAPSRLIPSDERIAPVKLPNLPKHFPLLQSGQGEQVSVDVVGAWMGFGRYITAVLMINQTPLHFVFDGSRLRGNFTHIASQHSAIGPQGSLTDRTTVYLISTVPFNEALMEDSYAY